MLNNTITPIMEAFGITTLPDQRAPEEAVVGAWLMNPTAYADLCQKLTHLRDQGRAAERTTTDIRIEIATLVHENIARVDHGQKQGIYDLAGMSRSTVSHIMGVKAMLMVSNVAPAQQLPSLAVLQDAAAKGVPRSVREAILSQPDITQREARALIQAAKAANALEVRDGAIPDTSLDIRCDIKPPALTKCCGAATNADTRTNTTLPRSAPAADPRLEAYTVIGLLPSASDAVVQAAIDAALKEHRPGVWGDRDKFARVQSAADTIVEIRREARDAAAVEQATAAAEQNRQYQSLLESLDGL